MQRSQRRPSLVRGVAVGAVVFLALLGCAPAGELVAGGVQRPVVEPEPEPEPEPELVGAWPLTGVEEYALPESDSLAASSASELRGASEIRAGFEAPALSVKIENSTGARPQAGLEDADIVWEELVEGGMTRFVAMFHSDLPEIVGPVRSVRGMDAAIAGPAGGVFAFSGGQPVYQQRIRETGMVMVRDDASSPGFFRDRSRRADHSLFGYPETFLGQAQGQDGPQELFSFAPAQEESTALKQGAEVAGVSLAFPASSPSWDWNGEVWERSESGSPALAASGARLQAQNVVVVFVQLRDTGLRDSAGSSVLETVMTGEGAATVFSDGRSVAARWEKAGLTDPMALRTEDGEAVLLDPGKTWVELLPASSGRMETF